MTVVDLSCGMSVARPQWRLEGRRPCDSQVWATPPVGWRDVCTGSALTALNFPHAGGSGADPRHGGERRYSAPASPSLGRNRAGGSLDPARLEEVTQSIYSFPAACSPGDCAVRKRGDRGACNRSGTRRVGAPAAEVQLAVSRPSRSLTEPVPPSHASPHGSLGFPRVHRAAHQRI
jgi:hypothetical protein